MDQSRSHETLKRECFELMEPVSRYISSDFGDDERGYEVQALEHFAKCCQRWLSESTVAELSGLKNILMEQQSAPADNPKKMTREQFIIFEVIRNLVVDNDIRPYTHGLLAHREAFLSEQSVFQYFTAFSCYLGLFHLDADKRTTILKYSKEGTIAVLKYEFEIGGGYLNIENSPVHLTSVIMPRKHRAVGNRTWTFNDSKLSDLIAREADRVDELITIATTCDNHDPAFLEEVLRNPSHQALLKGIL